jgi:thiamine-monophosphate kinase
MTSEAAFIAALRAIATTPAARGLADDAAVLEIGGARLVLTMDAIVEGVHFLPEDPAESVAWKLVATNVSDLAAKGARPCGCLLTYPLTSDEAWNDAFVRGLDKACTAFAIPLLGGDTVRQPEGSARSFTLVALGQVPADGIVPSRSGARAGDLLWVSGTIGDAGLGLALLRKTLAALPAHAEALTGRYRYPNPQPDLGEALARHVGAMMDISDGLLIDTFRLAQASGVAAVIELDRIPLSQAFVETCGEGEEARRMAASAGDDYCLLFAAPQDCERLLQDAALSAGCAIHQIGRIAGGLGLGLLYGGEAVALPERLGFEH